MSEGQKATLTCKTHGDPTPTMTFQKAGHQEYKLGPNVSQEFMVNFYACKWNAYLIVVNRSS